MVTCRLTIPYHAVKGHDDAFSLPHIGEDFVVDVRGKNQQSASFVINLISAKLGWQFQATVSGVTVLIREAPRIMKAHRTALRKILRRVAGVYANDS